MIQSFLVDNANEVSSQSHPVSHESIKEALVIFMPSGRRGHIAYGQSVLSAAQQLGVEIESICGGRLTCGKCKVRVEEGNFQKHGVVSSETHLSTPSEDEKELLARMDDHECRLSCQAYIQGDLLLYVPEEARGQKQIIRKSARERVIPIHPAIRQVYVEVEQAILGEHRGDWGRLQAALRNQWNLDALQIDFLVLRHLQSTLRSGDWKVTVTLRHDREVIDVQPGYVEGVYGVAIDLGSTTIVAHLCDLRTGKILASESVMNPQVVFGEDLMSRISYAMTNNDGLEKMHKAILDTLNKLIAQAARSADLSSRSISEVVLVGNTTMTHIVAGISPVELGGAPFALAHREAMDIRARDFGLRIHPSGYVHLLPSEAGHVGADNVGVLLAEEPHLSDEISLIVDVGTNAEIVLGNRERLFSASSPTGPAFEGAQIAYGMRAAPGAIERVRIDPDTWEPVFRVIGEPAWSSEWQIGAAVPPEEQPRHLAAGICGSGIIEVIAEMFLAGIILPDGRFNPDADHPRLTRETGKPAYILASSEYTANHKPILVTQDDVRNIQLAKAALYAGARLLMNKAQVSRLDRILLAGAFGSYIDPQHAMVLGLIPDCPLDKVFAVGNAAGDGARLALLNIEKRQEAQELATRVKYIETAVDPDFQEEFVNALHIPHASQPFNHLEGILPVKPAQSAPRKSRRFRSTNS